MSLHLHQSLVDSFKAIKNFNFEHAVEHDPLVSNSGNAKMEHSLSAIHLKRSSRVDLSRVGMFDRKSQPTSLINRSIYLHHVSLPTNSR